MDSRGTATRLSTTSLVSEPPSTHEPLKGLTCMPGELAGMMASASSGPPPFRDGSSTLAVNISMDSERLHGFLLPLRSQPSAVGSTLRFGSSTLLPLRPSANPDARYSFL